MSDDNPDLAARLAQVRRLYRNRLDETVMLIPVRWNALKAHGEWRDQAVADLEALNTMVHRLRGSAGTFGYPELSQALAPLDELLGRLRGSEGPPAATQRQCVDALVDRLVVVWKEI